MHQRAENIAPRIHSRNQGPSPPPVYNQSSCHNYEPGRATEHNIISSYDNHISQGRDDDIELPTYAMAIRGRGREARTDYDTWTGSSSNSSHPYHEASAQSNPNSYSSNRRFVINQGLRHAPNNRIARVDLHDSSTRAHAASRAIRDLRMNEVEDTYQMSGALNSTTEYATCPSSTQLFRSIQAAISHPSDETFLPPTTQNQSLPRYSNRVDSGPTVQATHPPHYRSHSSLRGDDECPICHCELSSDGQDGSEIEREAHVATCIERHFSSLGLHSQMDPSPLPRPVARPCQRMSFSKKNKKKSAQSSRSNTLPSHCQRTGQHSQQSQPLAPPFHHVHSSRAERALLHTRPHDGSGSNSQLQEQRSLQASEVVPVTADHPIQRGRQALSSLPRSQVHIVTPPPAYTELPGTSERTLHPFNA